MADKKSFDVSGEELDSIDADAKSRENYQSGELSSWVSGMRAALKKGLSADEADEIGKAFSDHQKAQKQEKQKEKTKSPLYDHSRSPKSDDKESE